MPLIMIDPGHGLPDPGVVGSRLTEADTNLKVSWKLAKALDRRGFQVTLTRPFTHRLHAHYGADLKARVELANRLNADLFISIHCNGAANPAACGHEVFWHKNSAKGEKLARLVNAYMSEAFPVMKNRGAKADTTLHENGLYVLRYTRMPAVLIELGFLSNPDDENWLATHSFQWLMAESIADAVQACLV